MAALLSTIHLNLHRWRLRQTLASVEINRSADAYPQSSLRVEDAVSLEPSTGPKHVKRVSVFVEMVHPNVPNLSRRPPSEAMLTRVRERKTFQMFSSGATWVKESKSRRCDGGSLLMSAVREIFGTGDGFVCVKGWWSLVVFDVGCCFQYGM
jgi:hypothetical protein